MSWRSRRKASRLKAWSQHRANLTLWRLTKRELIEIALFLASRLADDDDAAHALEHGGARDIINAERLALKRNGLL